MVVYGGKEYVKHRVSVVALHRLDGSVVPLTIVWDDKRRFDVELVGEAGRCRCEHTPGHAIKYPVLVRGRRRDLYYGPEGWFVECSEDRFQQQWRDPRGYYA